jgi:5-methylcytosine-specific restriction endonuclease McrA
MVAMLGLFYFFLILTAMITEGFPGFLLKIAVVIIPIYFIYENQQTKRNIEIRLREQQSYKEYEYVAKVEKRKRNNRINNQSKKRRTSKMEKINNSPKLLPKSDKLIAKSNTQANYILKTLRYVKESEPKFSTPNWSKNYKEPEYNKKIESELGKIFSGFCAYCGDHMSFVNKTLDHVMPRQKGGSNRIANILPCCRNCNSMKGSLHIGDFIIQEFKADVGLATWWIDIMKNKRGRNLVLKLQERK